MLRFDQALQARHQFGEAQAREDGRAGVVGDAFGDAQPTAQLADELGSALLDGTQRARLGDHGGHQCGEERGPTQLDLARHTGVRDLREVEVADPSFTAGDQGGQDGGGRPARVRYPLAVGPAGRSPAVDRELAAQRRGPGVVGAGGAEPKKNDGAPQSA